MSSGAGLGLLIWATLARLVLGPLPGFEVAVAMAAVLFTAGLLSSGLHLANPRNGWRAFTRFRHSWLSREGVFAVAVYPVAGLFLWADAHGLGGLALVSGVLLVSLGLMVLVCTGMIYACLKTVPHWRNWQTMVAYPLFGLMSGALLWLSSSLGVAADQALSGPMRHGAMLALLLLAAGGALKLSYYLRFARAPGLPSLNAAIGLPPGRVRLLDVGHSGRTFLTDEFVFALARERARLLRWVALGLGFALPGLLLAIAPRWTALAVTSCLAGLLVERWLFFAEARHVVRVYHGGGAL